MTDDTLSLTIHHHGAPHSFSFPPDALLPDLTAQIASTLHIPEEHQKLLISPKPGMQKPPFAPIRLDTLIPLSHPRLKITLLGTATQDIDSLHAQAAATQRRAESRSSALAAAAAKQHKSTTRSPGGIHTLSSSNSSNSFTFHRLLPLSYLPRPERSLQFLTRLRDDPGIRAAMASHQFSVPLLTEMDPAMHTTTESRTLGLNRNKGEVIELRLRTDAYDGYRDYRTIRKTLCHELAHCVFSEHDRDFWDLTAQIEREVDRGDWKHGGHRLTGQDFYNPGDWEQSLEAGGELVDERGWTGGEFVLGGLQDETSASASSSPAGGVESRRDVLARAAEERMKNERKGETRKQD
ncbi:hypothetical protein FE257_005113 [Aspergillus nanangensis]|uniref:WLM domain-containing protein n=1 Tax=Aspergillus nanangensis TaxID=2582783 RepID=A0AAD4GM84_ASPNN|nr:hypothetical protein FE257_005113 [Aspergillus nanangensis]